jgi:hypothetical protein
MAIMSEGENDALRAGRGASLSIFFPLDLMPGWRRVPAPVFSVSHYFVP